MFKAYKKFLKNYVNFKSKATCADYWWVFLIHSVSCTLFFVIVTIGFVTHIDNTAYKDELELILSFIIDMGSYLLILIVVMGILGLLLLIPLMSLQIRRFNDLGFKWQISLVVFLGLNLFNILTSGKSMLLMYLLSILPSDIFKRNMTGS